MKLSVVIIVKNEEDFIGDCLESIKFAGEILLLDGGSTDKTLEIARKFSVSIKKQKTKEVDYAAWRNQGKEEALGEWLLYIDADERITPLLKKEILEKIENPEFSVFAIPRRNFLLGKELKYGGWSPDYQIRLFKKEKLNGWEGKLHEHPLFEGEVGKLDNPMVHLQPEKIEPALEKSIKWSRLEANLIIKSHPPKIVWWRVSRMMLTTLFDRLIVKKGFFDGVEGWIESFYQSFHTMIVYLRVWEETK